MSDAPEAGGSSSMRRSLQRCRCPCVPDSDDDMVVVATEEDASVDSSNHCATTELVTQEVDSSNHCTTTQLVSNSQDNSDSTVQLSSRTRVTELLQPSIEVDDTATTHRVRVALQEEENRNMRLAEHTCNLMFLVYCLVGLIISLVTAMVLGAN